MHENPAIALWEYWHMSQQMRNPKAIDLLQETWKSTAPRHREQNSYLDPEVYRRYSIGTSGYLNKMGFSLDYRCAVVPYSLCAPEDEDGNPNFRADIGQWLPVYRLYQNATPVLSLWPDGRFIVHNYWTPTTLFKHTFLAYGYVASRRQIMVESPAITYVYMRTNDFIKSRRWYMGWLQLCTNQSYLLKPFEHGGWQMAVDTANGDFNRMSSALNCMKYANQLRDLRYRRLIRGTPDYRKPPTPLTTRALPDAIKSIKVYEPT